MKIFIHGRDKMNWSIDNDRRHLEKALKRLGYPITQSPLSCQIFYNIWWNLIQHRLIRWYFKARKPECVLATVTNDLKYQRDDFFTISPYIDYWIYANSYQKSDLVNYGIKEDRLMYNPFYVDIETFKNLEWTKEDLALEFQIPYREIKNKIIIGSFQRDSLGNDLAKPKWQKNPDLLLEICSKLDSSQYLLLLSGPRRHYIVRQCRLRKIPYFYVGNDSMHATNRDDIILNNQSLVNINKLYNIVDICLITSKSEGGPKAVLESTLAETLVLSTRVGMAPDILDSRSLCDTTDEFINKIKELTNNTTKYKELSEVNYKRVCAINNLSSYTDRISSIIQTAVTEI
ncbi:MAG: glycosyltransferase [Candidatus Marinimicrobia bacterium]|nr:glycosyltransferase [Candidatus Neomarinimicrobiota bacterium]